MLQHTYGISEEEYNKKWEAQGKGCAICKRPRKEGTRHFAVDHEHKSGVVRGILCLACNKWLIGCLERCYKEPRPVIEGLLVYINTYPLKGDLPKISSKKSSE